MTTRLIACASLTAALASGQPFAERPFKIVALDPALNAIVDPGTKLETLGDHFGLIEGPIWIQEETATCSSAITPQMSSTSGLLEPLFPCFWKTADIQERTI